jgi:GNAT superfamily N-acetyltransferase
VKVRLSVEPRAAASDRQIVQDGVDLWNVARTGLPEWFPLSIFLRDEHDDVRGGLLASGWGSWLRIETLWVTEALRGGGRGSQLLRAAEAYGRERGCRFAILDAFSFQARPFYERHGYAVFATLEDCPPGHARHFMKKAPRGEET